ncbi:EAL domain-containing protein [Robertmurraya massiliosenegalensis]|uniref:EAL domain-containing protein n=1 Tax=Robertmurraya TaxID=2837507 RepID=UPI0039A43C62
MATVIDMDVDKLYTYYQPLYLLEKHTLFSYESLLRSENEIPPNILFETARLDSQVNILDRIAIKKGLSSFHIQENIFLFLNVFPSTLIQEDFFDFLDQNLDQFGIRKNRIVFEINETISEANNWNMSELKRVIIELKKQGVKIAIDDVGTGIACSQKIIEIQPDFVKLARVIILEDQHRLSKIFP